MWDCSKLSKPVSPFIIVAYGLPALALSLPLIPGQVLVPAFYAANTAVTISTVGLVLFLSRCLDVLGDPFIGWLADRAMSAGRGFRRLVVFGAVLSGLSLYMLFVPAENAGGLWLFGWSALLFTGWSAVQIPYTVASARISARRTDRLRLNGSRELVGLLGLVGAALFIGLWPTETEADQLLGLVVMTLFSGAFGLVIYCLCVPVPQAGHSPAQGYSPLRVFRWFVRLWHDAPVRALVGAWLLNGMSNALAAFCFPLYVLLVLESSLQDRGLLLLVYFLCGIAFIPLWVRLAGKWEKHRVWCWAMLLACGAFLYVPLLSGGDFHAFLLICVITGAALGADLVLPPALQADVSDHDRLSVGQDRSGFLFSVWSMATKLSYGLAAGLGALLLSFADISENAASISDNGKILLSLIYAFVPVVLKIWSASIMWRFNLTKEEMKRIQQALS